MDTLIELCGIESLGDELPHEVGRSLATVAIELDEVKETYNIRLYDICGVAYLEFDNEVAVLWLAKGETS